MSTVESNSFCSSEKYEKLFPMRVNERYLKPDNFYISYMRVDDDRLFAPKKEVREAAKLLARVVSMEVDLLTVMFVNEDMQEITQGTMLMQDGLASAVQGVEIVEPSTSFRFPIQEIFLIQYDDGIPAVMLSDSKELIDPNTELF